MLEKLSAVPWADLEHAYGSADDVPDLLRALPDADPDVRAKARRALYGNIFHQGTRYQASAYAVPFLLELLADPATPERAALLSLLASLAVGYDESWLPEPFPIAEFRRTADGGEALPFASWESLSDPDQERMFAYIELSVYDAVRAGVRLYCTLLDDPDPAIRVAAAYALAWFSEDAATSAHPLTAAAADPHPAVAATALVALGLTGTAAPVLHSALTGGRDVVRWGAAIALARLDGPSADPAVVAELVSWAGGTAPTQADIPYLDGNASGYAGLASRHLGDAHADASFDALLARLPAVSGPDALPVAAEALDLAFPAGRIGPGTRFADLTARQQRLVRTLAGSPGTWGWGKFGQFGNFTALIHSYGLPHDAATMAAYAAT